MSVLLKVLVVELLLCPAVLATGSCSLQQDEETSLLQVKQEVQTGIQRPATVLLEKPPVRFEPELERKNVPSDKVVETLEKVPGAASLQSQYPGSVLTPLTVGGAAGVMPVTEQVVDGYGGLSGTVTGAMSAAVGGYGGYGGYVAVGGVPGVGMGMPGYLPGVLPGVLGLNNGLMSAEMIAGQEQATRADALAEAAAGVAARSAQQAAVDQASAQNAAVSASYARQMASPYGNYGFGNQYSNQYLQPSVLGGGVLGAGMQVQQQVAASPVNVHVHHHGDGTTETAKQEVTEQTSVYPSYQQAGYGASPVYQYR